ncbi:MAG: phytanoyl-CoA dioxygenase family protein [Planctomycetota bacterium]|nr:phytanoyl-CoA dioxygenase family protein [Planctomycetota bacterium]
MSPNVSDRLADLETAGFMLWHNLFSLEEMNALRIALDRLVEHNQNEDSIRRHNGGMYAARNVLELCPVARTIWRKPAVIEWLTTVLGRGCGLVRGLYFDKPPEQSWGLPWHKDLKIAVRPDPPASRLFSKPGLRAGVPHCEAPLEVLEQMLTLRIHIDAQTEDNGPLAVLIGSHRTGKEMLVENFEPRMICGESGSVLAMRPLLIHSSHRAKNSTTMHRRILHLEFAAKEELPDGHVWWEFYEVGQ